MQNKRVVIVEDEPLVAVSIAKKLTRMGLDVIGTFESGKEAVPSIINHPPDLVLLDIKLSHGEDGIDVAHEIHRTFDRWPNCPSRRNYRFERQCRGRLDCIKRHRKRRRNSLSSDWAYRSESTERHRAYVCNDLETSPDFLNARAQDIESTVEKSRGRLHQSRNRFNCHEIASNITLESSF